jgi:predicted Zn finger-like uncharacterized protein
MYTQCPDCSTAFRVTAEILRQAAGKVRCGGCGNAFNALEYLSESMPEKAPPKEPEERVPELTPEPLSDKVPKSISAEQSAALLKTLDELAGSDIRIEDTGVEWRVLDEDELGEAAADEIAVDMDVEDQPRIDEILEASPTPVDQFLTDTPPQVDSPEIFAGDDDAASQTSVDELRFDDNTPLPDDFDLDREAPYSPPEPEPEPEPAVEEVPQADLDLSEPGEWTDILDEFEGIAGDLAETGPDSDDAQDLDEEEANEAEPASARDETENSVDEPLDMDSQFALQAEAMGIDLSGTHETVGSPEETPGAVDDLEALLEESGEEVKDLEDLLEEEFVDEDDANDETVIAGDEDEDEDTDEDADEDFGREQDADGDEVSDDYEDLEESAQLELIDDEPFDEFESEEAVDASDEHYLPPLTEEEQTINMQIDEDLLAIAVEDEDGFASTMVLPEDAAEEKAEEEKAEIEESAEEAETALKDTGAGFETIIMEGEAFRSAVDEEKQEEHKAAAAASLASVAQSERDDEEAARAAAKRKYGIAAGIAALALLLVGQYVHQARDSLATIPAFNSVVGPVYRAIGKPLSPDWDITGWRFEVTKGSTEEEDGALTVFSRIGNTSESALPYPLIGISLTDRFEETIGSRVLDPADYLSRDLDPRKLVQPGNTFNAVITIEAPSEDATGFKLNVCYRETGGSLRCAIDDFL